MLGSQVFFVQRVRKEDPKVVSLDPADVAAQGKQAQGKDEKCQ